MVKDSKANCWYAISLQRSFGKKPGILKTMHIILCIAVILIKSSFPCSSGKFKMTFSYTRSLMVMKIG